MTPQQVTAFETRPDSSSSYHDKKVVEFDPKTPIVAEFFQAITDSVLHQPMHDTTSTQWGIQIHTDTVTLTSWYYIPTDTPEIVVGNIESASGNTEFESHRLLRWYQKYGHYWQLGGYQKLQYRRVKPFLTSIVPSNITFFKMSSTNSPSLTNQEMNDYTQDKELVTAFFHALEDMRFVAPRYQAWIEQWNIQIMIHTTTITLFCSIPRDDPTIVIGLIDSPAGYSYFSSHLVYQWYQTYHHRWQIVSQNYLHKKL